MRTLRRSLAPLWLIGLVASQAVAQLTITVDEATETFVITGSVEVEIGETFDDAGGMFGVTWSDSDGGTIIPMPKGAFETSDPILFADISIDEAARQRLRIRWRGGSSPPSPNQTITGNGLPVSYASATEGQKLALEASDMRVYGCSSLGGPCASLIIDSPTAELEKIQLVSSASVSAMRTLIDGASFTFEPGSFSLIDTYTNGAILESQRPILDIRSPYGGIEPAMFETSDEVFGVYNGVWTFIIETEPGVTHTFEADLSYEPPFKDFISFDFPGIRDRDPYPQPFEFDLNAPGPKAELDVVGFPRDGFEVSIARIGSEVEGVFRTAVLAFETTAFPDDFLSSPPAFATRLEFQTPFFIDRSQRWTSESVTSTPGAPLFEVASRGGRFAASATIEFTRAINACLADGNLDGVVGMGDFGELAAEFLRDDCIENIGCKYDLDADGDVDLGDFGIFGAEFGRTDCND
ncbi:MAG: hypothetical protein AAGH64_05935 [Planctomycetota bacterium]